MVSLLMMVLCIISANAQVEFEKGWITDGSGARIDCLIRNRGWRTSPESFEYRLDGDGKILQGDLMTVSEFGVGDYHFIRKEVDVDTSRPSIENYTKGAAPELVRMKVYLFVLSDGDFKLYSYKGGTYKDSYYYSLGESEPQYLIHKNYIGTSGGVMENNAFRQQLKQVLAGVDTGGVALDKLTYNEKSLGQFFDKLNGIHQDRQKSWGRVQLSAFAGAGVVTSNFKNFSTRPRQYFGPDFSVLAGGVEMEYSFPFYRDKLALVLAPEVYSFSQESYWEPVAAPPVEQWVKFSTLNIPIALRYKMFLGTKVNLYVDLGVSAGLPFNADINVTGFQYMDINRNYNLVCGAGVNLFDRVSVGLKGHYFDKVFADHTGFDSRIDVTELVISCNLFSFPKRR